MHSRPQYPKFEHARMWSRSRRTLGVLATLAMATACSDAAEPPSTGSVAQAVVAQSYPFTIRLPENRGLNELPLLALERIEIADRAKVWNRDLSPGPVVSTGTGGLDVGVEAAVGTVTSLAGVSLRDRAKVTGDVMATGQVQRGNAVAVSGTIQQNVSVPTKTIERRVEFPGTMQPAVSIPPDTAATPVAPGAYAKLEVFSRSTAVLRSGEYYLDELFIEPQAVLRIDDAAGPVIINVRTRVRYGGAVERAGNPGDVPRLLVNYVGTERFVLDRPFAGSIVAPFAELELQSVGSVPHRGSFFAKRLIVRPDANVIHHPFIWLIRGLDFSNANPCDGEPIQATARTEPPSTAGEEVHVSINGIPSSSRYLVFRGAPGPRLVTVVASAGGVVESQTFSVNVTSCQFLQPRLGASPTFESEVSWRFWLTDLPSSSGSRSYVWDFGDGTTSTTSVPSTEHGFRAASLRDVDYRTFAVKVTVREDGQADIVVPRTVVVGTIYAVNRKKGLLTPDARGGVMENERPLWRGEYWIQNPESEALTLTPTVVTYSACSSSQEPERAALSGAVAITVPPESEVEGILQVPPPTDWEVCSVAVHLTGASASGLPAETTLYFRPQNLPTELALESDPRLTALLEEVSGQGLSADRDRVSEAELQRLGREGTIAFPLPPEPSLVTFEDPVPGERCNPGDTSRPGYFCRATDKWAVVPGELANAEKGDIVMSPSCGGIIGSLLYALKPAQFYSHTGIMIEDRSDIYHTTTPGERPEFYPANGKTLPTDGFDGNVMKYGWPGTLSQPPFEAFWGQWMPDPKGYGLNVHAFGYETKTCDLDELQPLKPPVVIKPPWNSSQQVRATLHQLADEVATINGHYRFYAYTDAKMAFDPQYAPSGSLPDHSAWALEKPLPSMCSSLIWAGAQRLKDRGISITLEGDEYKNEDLERYERGKGTVDGLYYYPAEDRQAAAEVFHTKTYNKVIEASSELAEDLTHIASEIATQSTLCFGYDKCDSSNRDDTALEVCPGYAAVYALVCAAAGTCPIADPAWEVCPGIGDTVSPDNLELWDAPGEDGSSHAVYGFEERLHYTPAEWRRVYEWVEQASTGKVYGTVTRGGIAEAQAALRIGEVTRVFTDADGHYEADALPVEAQGTLYPIYAGKMIDDPAYLDEPYLGKQEYYIGYAEPLVKPTSCPADLGCDPEADPEGTRADIELLDGNPDYREVHVRGTANVVKDARASAKCIACNATPCSLFGCCEGACWPSETHDFDLSYQLNPWHTYAEELKYPSSWCAGNQVQGMLEVHLGLNPADRSVGGQLFARMWEKRNCEYDSDREGSEPHADFLVLPDQTLSLAELKSTRDNEYARFYNLEVANQTQRGTTPIPGPLPGQDEGVERTRRRVVIMGDLIVHDADWFDFSGTGHAPVYLELQVDPWERKASDEWSWCEENQILGTVKATAYLEDDLLGVRVVLETSVEHAGTSWWGFPFVNPHPRDDCGKPKKCGKGYTVFTVSEGGEVAAETGDVACDENPVRPDEKKSFTRFVGAIRNEVWTP